MKKTKIICSIGPMSNDPDVMEKMVLAGMNVARINFSHATDEERLQALESVRIVRKRTGKNVAILWDTKGPEFRSGTLEGDKIELVEGSTIRLVKDDVLGNIERITVNHPEALDSLEVGSAILLENGKMRIEVISKENDGVTCKIVNGGFLGNRKSISVPGIKLNIPYISTADKEDIKYACEHGGEILALSFVSSKEDVLEVKKLLKRYGREDFIIISKIESELGIQNLEEILEVSDGIMVARGDLGNEIPFSKITVVQKELIRAAREAGKICVVATEMLETMMENARPKRAESSDIANAVLDGTDAVMLSGETTMGKHPIETVAAMAKICEDTEDYVEFDYISDEIYPNSISDAIAECVVSSSNKLDAKVICVSTITGQTAKMISNLKPNAPVLAMVQDEKSGRRLALNWGVYPVVVTKLDTTDAVIEQAISCAKEKYSLTKKDKIVITGCLYKDGEISSTNLMKIAEITE